MALKHVKASKQADLQSDICFCISDCIRIDESFELNNWEIKDLD